MRKPIPAGAEVQIHQGDELAPSLGIVQSSTILKDFKKDTMMRVYSVEILAADFNLQHTEGCAIDFDEADVTEMSGGHDVEVA